MNADYRQWIAYANENLAVAWLALESGYYNACLQNVQQSVEKYLKAALLARDVGFQKTHSIETLHRQLQGIGLDTGLSSEDCDLLDTIYVPTKYPMGRVLPHFNPDKDIGLQCVEIAERVRVAVQMKG